MKPKPKKKKEIGLKMDAIEIEEDDGGCTIQFVKAIYKFPFTLNKKSDVLTLTGWIREDQNDFEQWPTQTQAFADFDEWEVDELELDNDQSQELIDQARERFTAWCKNKHIKISESDVPEV